MHGDNMKFGYDSGEMSYTSVSLVKDLMKLFSYSMILQQEVVRVEFVSYL